MAKKNKTKKYREELCLIGKQLCVLNKDDEVFILDESNSDFAAERRLRTARLRVML